MGDRGQVKIIQSDGELYLYTHWGASDLVDDVRHALSRKERWNDEEYLTRIIFCEMLRDSGNPLDEATGFGIGLTRHSDIWREVVVDVPKQTVAVRDSYGEGAMDPVSFGAFVENGVRVLAELAGESSG